MKVRENTNKTCQSRWLALCWQMLFREAFTVTSTQCWRKTSRPSITQRGPSPSPTYSTHLILGQVWWTESPHNHFSRARRTCTCNYLLRHFHRKVVLYYDCHHYFNAPYLLLEALKKKRPLQTDRLMQAQGWQRQKFVIQLNVEQSKSSRVAISLIISNRDQLPRQCEKW